MTDAPLVRSTSRSAAIILEGEFSRRVAKSWIDRCADGWVVTLESEPRTRPQQDKIWAVCTALEKSDVTWAGARQTKVSWHDLLLHAYALQAGMEPKMIPGLEGGVICQRRSIKDLSKEQASELIEYAISWAASHGVTGGE